MQDTLEVLAEHFYEYRTWLISVFSMKIPDCKKHHTPGDISARSDYIEDLKKTFDKNQKKWSELTDGEKANYRHWVDAFVQKLNKSVESDLLIHMNKYVGRENTPELQAEIRKDASEFLANRIAETYSFIPNPPSL